jgi:hypothetical protein
MRPKHLKILFCLLDLPGFVMGFIYFACYRDNIWLFSSALITISVLSYLGGRLTEGYANKSQKG